MEPLAIRLRRGSARSASLPSKPSRSHADKLVTVPDQEKPPVFLLDAMSFIFRAYHAMQRSRPMSTRSGLPTAATYVFVNMIKKLRQDFSPRYFAAVFDPSGAVFRDERAQRDRYAAQVELKIAEL